MTKISIKNPEYLVILDDITSEKYYGCNQEWYKKPWQRMAGCGPTVASNIILYKRNNIGISKNDSIAIMEEMWKHVTPTMKGVNSTNIFYNGLLSYAKNKSSMLQYDAIDVPKKKDMQPTFERIINFIKISLENDLP